MLDPHEEILRRLRVCVEGVNTLYGGPLTDESFEQMNNHLRQILYVLDKDVCWCWRYTRPFRWSTGYIEPSRAHEEILKEIENLKNLTKSPKVAKKLEELWELLLRAKDVVRDPGSFL